MRPDYQSASASIPPAERTRRPKWHYLYFVLAGFDVLTVCVGLYLTRTIMSIYVGSVAVNQIWAERVSAYSRLGELAAAVNAPGNDVFDSREVDAEARRMRAALQAFDQKFATLRSELQAQVAPAEAEPLIARLDAVGEAMEAMTGEGQLIFSYFRANLPDRAGERMATMDRKYAVVNTALAQLRDAVATIQHKNFEQQMAAAANQQKYEYLIGALILLMVSGATFYGHRLAKQIDSDFTERERHLQEIAEARATRERQQLIEREKDALQAADRAKDEFLAMLSHELRTPLAALATAAHVLKMCDPGGDAAVQARGVIDRQTKHMSRLIEDLLDISRITMGKAALDRGTFDLAEMASSVVHIWRSTGLLVGDRISVDVSPVWVDADRSRIEQILSNLLDNALKFTPAGKGVEVSVRREGADAVLEVSDEGEGLAPDMIGRLFNLFAQGEHGLHRGKGGLGIGLALVKRLAEMHGGSASAASAGLGRGAVFTVRLPAVARPDRHLAPSAARQPGGPRRILIVEDNDDTRKMLCAALALDGHEVCEARDGVTGLAVAAEAHPEVALIDIGLPDIDGYEVARRVRSSSAGARIALIALTGYGQPGDQRRAFDAGFDAHLTKPVAFERLNQAIAAFH